jgi:hypothetical protein
MCVEKSWKSICLDRWLKRNFLLHTPLSFSFSVIYAQSGSIDCESFTIEMCQFMTLPISIFSCEKYEHVNKLSITMSTTMLTGESKAKCASTVNCAIYICKHEADVVWVSSQMSGSFECLELCLIFIGLRCLNNHVARSSNDRSGDFPFFLLSSPFHPIDVNAKTFWFQFANFLLEKL